MLKPCGRQWKQIEWMNTECLDDLHMVHVGSEFLHPLSHGLLHVWLHSLAVAAITKLLWWWWFYFVYQLWIFLLLYALQPFVRDKITLHLTFCECLRLVTFRNLVGNLFFFAHILWNFLWNWKCSLLPFLKALKTNGHAGSFFVTVSCFICGNVYKGYYTVTASI